MERAIDWPGMYLRDDVRKPSHTREIRAAIKAGAAVVIRPDGTIEMTPGGGPARTSDQQVKDKHDVDDWINKYAHRD